MSPFQRFPGGPAPFRAFQRAYVGRMTGPIGCLVLLVLVPVVLAVGLVAAVAWIATSPFRTKTSAPFRPTNPEDAAHDEALRRLVRAMALDDTFTAEEARQAGTLVAGGATVDSLLDEAVQRRWVERRGDRLAVTPRGREETGERRLDG